MWMSILGLPLVFVGLFTRVYGWEDDSSKCFWIDHVSWGAACFTGPGVIIPYIVAYGSWLAGMVLLIMGWRKIRQAKAGPNGP